jgi:hypothetical protein
MKLQIGCEYESPLLPSNLNHNPFEDSLLAFINGTNFELRTTHFNINRISESKTKLQLKPI